MSSTNQEQNAIVEAEDFTEGRNVEAFLASPPRLFTREVFVFQGNLSLWIAKADKLGVPSQIGVENCQKSSKLGKLGRMP